MAIRKKAALRTPSQEAGTRTKAPAIPIAYRPGYRMGLDENGLGPRLGPLVVTAVSVQLDSRGAAALALPLPQEQRRDLDDSKALVSCQNYSIAEAWARSVYRFLEGEESSSPEQLLCWLCPEALRELRRPCPKNARPQCWNKKGERFTSSQEQCDRTFGHLERWKKAGIELRSVRSELLCTKRLNDLKATGVHRFMADLHAMERLIVAFQEEVQQPVEAVCGKVGGIGKYEPFFGPLSGRLVTALEQGQGLSSYYFPQLGTLHFARDADSFDPLVMLASLVGKFLRELTMNRISRFYLDSVDVRHSRPSGYHDPVTREFVAQSAARRVELQIASDCFERAPSEKAR